MTSGVIGLREVGNKLNKLHIRIHILKHLVAVVLLKRNVPKEEQNRISS